MSLRKNILVNYGSQVINTGLAFISSVFITRLLGAEGRGEYSLFASSLQLFVVWLGFSLPVSIIYFVAGEKISKDRIFSTMLLFCILTTLLVILLLTVLNYTGGLWIIFPERFRGINWQLFFVAQFFILQLNGIIIAYLNAFKIFTPQAKFASVIAFLSLVVWALLYFKIINLPWSGFQLVVFVSFILSIPLWLFGFYLLRKNKIVVFTKSLLKTEEFIMVMKFAFIAYLCNAMQFLSYRMDFWFVDYFRGSTSLGVYSLAAALAQLFWILPNAISQVLFSYFSDTKNKNILNQAIQYAHITFIVSLIGAVLFFLLAFFAIPFLYGKEFSNAGWMIGILLLGVLPFTITTILASFFAGTNRLFVNFRTSLIGLVFAALGYILLIPHWGVMGACIASVISYNASSVYIYYKFYKTTGNKIWKINPLTVLQNMKASLLQLAVLKKS
ncbi:MAG TPA: polysaccharide biosynthesis C-terminal domain-containing protein [Chitinophagaceae bacterium]|nr:polysaccharide biosynthesis C-terminal domain-containing protein [Chitinophagaceae bacterium]